MGATTQKCQLAASRQFCGTPKSLIAAIAVALVFATTIVARCASLRRIALMLMAGLAITCTQACSSTREAKTTSLAFQLTISIESEGAETYAVPCVSYTMNGIMGGKQRVHAFSSKETLPRIKIREDQTFESQLAIGDKYMFHVSGAVINGAPVVILNYKNTLE